MEEVLAEVLDDELVVEASDDKSAIMFCKSVCNSLDIVLRSEPVDEDVVVAPFDALAVPEASDVPASLFDNSDGGVSTSFTGAPELLV